MDERQKPRSLRGAASKTSTLSGARVRRVLKTTRGLDSIKLKTRTILYEGVPQPSAPGAGPRKDAADAVEARVARLARPAGERMHEEAVDVDEALEQHRVAELARDEIAGVLAGLLDLDLRGNRPTRQTTKQFTGDSRAGPSVRAVDRADTTREPPLEAWHVRSARLEAGV